MSGFWFRAMHSITALFSVMVCLLSPFHSVKTKFEEFWEIWGESIFNEIAKEEITDECDLLMNFAFTSYRNEATEAENDGFIKSRVRSILRSLIRLQTLFSYSRGQRHHWALRPGQMEDLIAAKSFAAGLATWGLVSCYDFRCLRGKSGFSAIRMIPRSIQALQTNEECLVHRKKRDQFDALLEYFRCIDSDEDWGEDGQEMRQKLTSALDELRLIESSPSPEIEDFVRTRTTVTEGLRGSGYLARESLKADGPPSKSVAVAKTMKLNMELFCVPFIRRPEGGGAEIIQDYEDILVGANMIHMLASIGRGEISDVSDRGLSVWQELVSKPFNLQDVAHAAGTLYINMDRHWTELSRADRLSVAKTLRSLWVISSDTRS
jgi:hypothetical protein